ncbi:MAG: type IV conjugative transfer system coupling protein TraD [Alphaproteobacteria bacterium]|nr:type IV conjugative transfer system coupling protein TraD [Alphaproteobacteria bacterium]
MGGHPVEALLRPPAELTAGTVSVLCGAVAALGPEYLMMTPDVGHATAALLGLHGGWWLRRGGKVVRYQRNLRRRRRFSMRAKAIPVSGERLYLGRGFRWGERHTQRLHDCRKTRFRRFVEPGRIARWAAAVAAKAKEAGGSRVAQVLTADVPLNPFRAPPPVGGSSWLHGVEPDEEDVYLPLRDRSGHTLVLGTTQVGKTRMLEVAVTQDIRRGEAVVVFDPKGDADLLRAVRDACRDAKRADDFVLFHLGYPELSSRYNGVGQFHRVTEVATRVSGQVSGEGQSAVFREFVWRFVNVVARAVVALGQRPDYRTILKHVTNIDELCLSYAESHFAGRAEVLAAVARIERRRDAPPRHMEGRPRRLVAFEQAMLDGGLGDEVLDGLRSAMRYEKSYFDKLVASLLPLLEKLTTGKAADLLSPDYLAMDEARPVWDWRRVVNQKLVVYVGLDALSDAPVAAAVGNSMFADLVSYAGERYKHGDTHGFPEGVESPRHPIVVHMDEFNELMGDEFIPLLNKGGAAGVQVTAYTQTFSDIQARTRDASKARQVSGNFNALVMFRVKDIDTAALLTDQLPTVSVVELTQIAGYTDSSDPGTDVDFSSRHEDRITSSQATMLEPHDVTRLPKGEAFALLEGGVLWKVRLPLPAGGRREASAAFAELTADMERRYRPGVSWWAGAAETLPEAAGG